MSDRLASPAPQAPAVPPLLGMLDRFTAAGVPARGPAEAEAPARNWPEPSTVRGLDWHPMLYAGEGYNMLFVVNRGKVLWTYSLARGGEIDDVWMLTNGHILFTTQFHVYEVTPHKEVVWNTTRRREPRCIPASRSVWTRSCSCGTVFPRT